MECVDVSQNVTMRFAEHAMNPPCLGMAIHEGLLSSGDSQIVDPVDVLICLILLSDMTKRSSLNQRRPVL